MMAVSASPEAAVLGGTAPGAVHPVLGRTIKELRQDIKEVQGVFKWEID